MAEKKVVLLEVDIDNSKAIKSQAELLVSIEKVKKEQKELKKSTNGLTDATEEQSKAYAQNDVKLKTLQEESRRYTRVLKDNTKEQNKNKKIITQTNGSINSLRNAVNINRDAYRSLTKAERENSKAGKDLLKLIQKQDKEYKDLSKSIGNNQVEVGNYSKAWQGLNKVFGALGITFAITSVINLGKELNTLYNESRGVQFAFEKLGESGVRNFEAIKESTRGTLSNLDIKRSLVEFDNFNISLDQSADLFEFLAVRATQTGVSIDKLKSSLVEGLSKESKLRIDNLGISASQLNAELEKTPDFVEAVANIAKREVAEAGAILDEAGNSQAKWNAEIANTKEAIASKLTPALNRLFAFTLSGVDNVISGFSRLFNLDTSDFDKNVEKQIQASIKGASAFRDFIQRLGINEKRSKQELAKSFLETDKNYLSQLISLENATEKQKQEFAKQNFINYKNIKGEELHLETNLVEAKIQGVYDYIKQSEQAEAKARQNKKIADAEAKKQESKEAREQQAIENKRIAEAELKAQKELTEKLALAKIKEQEEEVKRQDKQYELLNQLRETDKEKEITSIVSAYEEKFLLAVGNSELEIELAREQAEKIASIESEYNQKYIEEENKKLEIKKVIEDQKLQLASGVLGAVAGLLDEETSAYKAFAIAQVGIDTYLTAQKAYLSQFLPVPDPTSPVRGAVASGIAIATGLGNIKKIAGFAEGSDNTQPLTVADYSNHTGIVTGTPNISMPNGDNMLATIKTGEAILNDKQQATINSLVGFDAIKYAVNGYADGTAFTGTDTTSAVSRNVVNNSTFNNSNGLENSEFIVDVKDVIRETGDYKTRVQDAII